jgi:predicted nucleotidyltransferase
MNTGNALATEYAGLIRHRLGARVREIILFGSRARGDAEEASDYDCVVVVDRKTPDVREAILDADVAMLDRHERLFAALLYSENEWQRAKNFPLGWNILKEGVVL